MPSPARTRGRRRGCLAIGLYLTLSAAAVARTDPSLVLQAPPNEASKQFGAAVAMSGDRALVGAPGDDSVATDAGASYVHDLSNGQIIHKVTVASGQAQDHFGSSVALSGTTAVIGAWGDDQNGNLSGAAYVFDATTGQQVFKLSPSHSNVEQRFGHSVAIDGNVIAVGAWGDTVLGENSGAVYLFDATTGQEFGRLVAPDGAQGDQFGISVAISGGLVVAGAHYADDGAPISGTAYVFDVSSQQLVTKLHSPSPGYYDWFGMDVDVDEGVVVVGEMWHDVGAAEGNQGAVHGFDALTGQILFSYQSNSTAWLGDSVAVADDVAVATQGFAPSALAVSASTGGLLHTLESGFGYDVAATPGRYLVGKYLFEPLTPIVEYGQGCAGTGAITPGLELSGTAEPGNTLTVAIEQGVGGGLALLLFGLQDASVPLAGGCSLLVSPVLQPVLGPFSLGGTGPGQGSLSFGAPIPPDLVPIVTVTMQAFVIDAGVPSGYANTNGVTLNIQ